MKCDISEKNLFQNELKSCNCFINIFISHLKMVGLADFSFGLVIFY